MRDPALSRCPSTVSTPSRPEIDNSESNGLISEEAWQSLTARLKLSMREQQIARRVFTNRKLTAIALDLGISPHTVRTYMERLYRKLGVRSRVELTLTLVRHSLYLTSKSCTPQPVISSKQAGAVPSPADSRTADG